jgi:hypothetical protein
VNKKDVVYNEKAVRNRSYKKMLAMFPEGLGVVTGDLTRIYSQQKKKLDKAMSPDKKEDATPGPTKRKGTESEVEVKAKKPKLLETIPE